LQEEGAEADDWIGTYAKRAEAAGWHTVIASSDKDFQQLVNDRVGLFNPNDKSDKIWGAVDVEAKIGVGPALVVDWLALVGDTVDNIPGVPGVGPKTATDLLKRYGSIDGLLAGITTIKHEKLRRDLEAHAERLRRNQLMVRLRCDLSNGPELETLAPRPRDKPQLREMYRRWGFRSLLSELGDDGQAVQGQLL
jgi:DNA polymerase-1